MAKPRKELHKKLCKLLGNTNCYFSPPASILMRYPSIRYHMDSVYSSYANNKEYKNLNRYVLTYITKDPDDFTMVNRLKDVFNYVRLDRIYTADGLMHYVMTLYY